MTRRAAATIVAAALAAALAATAGSEAPADGGWEACVRAGVTDAELAACDARYGRESTGYVSAAR